MKKRKILYLFPLAALVLSGCTFQEGWETVKSWVGNNIYFPVRDFLFGKKDDDKKDEQQDNQTDDQSGQDDQGGGGEGGGGEGGEGGGGGGGGQGVVTEHAGTEADPYSGADAVLVANSLEADAATSESYYIKGVVTQFEEQFDPQYGNYSFMIEGGFIAWRLKFGSTYQKFNDGDIEIGDTVTMYAQIQNYKGEKPETKGGYVVTVEKQAIDAELVGIELGGQPQTAYLSGAAYNHNGLSVTALYDNQETQDVSLSADWSYSKETAEVGDTEVTITASYGGFEDSMTVAVTVQDSSSTEHAGTEADPYTGADACIVANGLEVGGVTEGSFYIKGVVTQFEEAFNTQYGNYSFMIEGGFVGWRLKNGPDKVAFNEGDIEIGDTVTMYAQIQNYNGTPETKNGYVVSVEKAPVVITAVELSASELALEVGQQAALTASVLPAKASQEVEWSIAQESEVVAYQNGMVVALAAGSAVVTATSVADPTISASCSVTVTEATKTLTGIEFAGAATTTEYVEGDAYSAAGLTVMAVYDSGNPEDITDNCEITISPETATYGDESFTVSATYGNEIAQTTVSVTVSIKKGTQEHPYSVSEAYAVFQTLAQGANTEEVYVEGYINSTPAPTLASGRGRFYLTDGACATDMYVYNMNNTENTNALTLEEIPVGGKALVKGAIKNYQGGFQICYVSGTANCMLVQAVDAPVISSVGTPVGPSEVGVGGTILPASVSVPVVYSGVVNSTVTPTSVTGDFSTAGTATVDVVIAGWNETLHFDITVVAGTVLQETEVYKLDGTITGGSNGYADAGEITQSNVTWTVMGNTTMNPWRIGGKSITAVDRPVTSQGVVSADDITKVVVSTGTASSCTVNSITLNVGTTVGASDVSSISLTSNLVNADVTFERPANADWSSKYFTIIFNVTVSGSSNKFVQLNAITFYAMK